MLLPAALLMATPSIWKLFFSGLAPFTLMLIEPFPKDTPLATSTATPGAIPNTAVKFRAGRGSEEMVFPVTVVPIVEVAV